ncbi:MAG: hypothetical protein AAGI92_04020 [Pseudomonadota bacterium]
MLRRFYSVYIAVFFAMSSASAFAQTSTIGTLLQEGYEIKTMTSANVPIPGEDPDRDAIFVILQKDTTAYGCVMQTVDSSFCQRMR